MDWFPWYPALYRADTLDMTLEEDGAYRRLIDHYMETRMPIPDNDNAISRIIGISVNDFQAIAKQVRSKFYANDGVLHSKRCDIELDRQDSLSKKRSNAAKHAAGKRNKNKVLQASAEQMPSNSTDTGQDKTIQKEDIVETISRDFVKIWNDTFQGSLPDVQKISPSREKAINLRYADTFESNVNNWKETCERIKQMPHLMGNNGWKASFDWVLKPANLTKILEGNYKNGKSTNNGGGKAASVATAVRDVSAQFDLQQPERHNGGCDPYGQEDTPTRLIEGD